MSYSEHVIETVSPALGVVQCRCQEVIRFDAFANHVAASIVQGLTERCAEAEQKLGKQAEAKADPWVTKESATEYDRLTGKKAGVALARSYIEEVLR